MKNIAIIGAGQLGSRHLQALSRLSFESNIFVVDPNDASLETARERFNSVAQNLIFGINYVKNIRKIPENLDFSIIATNSNVRRKVIVDLLNQSICENILLEKVLFQKLEDYIEVDNLFIKKNINAWVNCSRRMWKFYKYLNRIIKYESINKVLVTGTDWGLACNSIHFIDLISFLCRLNKYSLINHKIDKVVESKRNGYFDIIGELGGNFNNNLNFKFVSSNSGSASITIKIFTSSNLYIVKENHTKNTIRFWINSKEQILEKSTLLIPYQSELTNIIVSEALGAGKVDLPIYSESARLHIPLILYLMTLFNNSLNKRYNLCPIT